MASKFGGKDSNVAANLLLRARIVAPWNRDSAYADLREAHRRILQLKDNSLQQSFLSDLVVAEHELSVKNGESGNLEDLQKALKFYEDRKVSQLTLLAFFSSVRKRKFTEDTRSKQRRIWLQGLIIRKILSDISDRASFMEEWQDLFEEMVRLQVDLHGDSQRAFEFAELSRTPFCDRAADLSCLRSPGFEEVRNAIPYGIALVEYFVLPERV